MVDLGWFRGFDGTPLWAAPSTKEVLMIGYEEPPSLSTELRKLLVHVWLTLACFSRKIVQKQIDPYQKVLQRLGKNPAIELASS